MSTNYLTVFRVTFLNGDAGAGTWGTATMTIEDFPFVPSVELVFNHPLLDSGEKPASVSFDLESGAFDVAFPNRIVSRSEYEARRSNHKDWEFKDW